MKKLLIVPALILSAAFFVPTLTTAQDAKKPAEPKRVEEPATEKKEITKVKVWEYSEQRAKADPENKDFWSNSSADLTLMIPTDKELGTAIRFALAKDFKVTANDDDKEGKPTENLVTEQWGEKDAEGLIWSDANSFHREVKPGQLLTRLNIASPPRRCTLLSASGEVSAIFAKDLTEKKVSDAHKAKKGAAVFEDADAGVRIEVEIKDVNEILIKITGSHNKILDMELTDKEGQKIFGGTSESSNKLSKSITKWVNEDDTKAFGLKFSLAKSVTKKKFNVAINGWELP